MATPFASTTFAPDSTRLFTKLLSGTVVPVAMSQFTFTNAPSPKTVLLTKAMWTCPGVVPVAAVFRFFEGTTAALQRMANLQLTH
jgi:hypothetical protein